MKVNCIDLFYVKLPLENRKPGYFSEPAYFTPSWIPGFRQSEMRFYLLRLGTDQGHEGYAAMPAMGTERKSLGALLGNYLMGVNPMDISLVNQRIQEFSYIGMRNGWVDAAFWDLIGKIRDEPLWKILGGTGGHVYPYMSTGSTHNHDQTKVRQIARQAMDSGYRGLKLRVKNADMATMADYIGAARDVVGETMDLMVDANQGWPVDLIDETQRWDLEFATRFAKGIEQYDISWLEEPLNRGGFEALAQLRNNTIIPIAGGELNSSWRDFKTMLDIGSLDIYQPDAVLAGGTYAGGISVVYWLIREIQNRNGQNDTGNKLKFCPHTWSTGLNFALALQLIGVVPEEERSLIEYPLEGHWKPEYWAGFIKSGFNPDQQGRFKIPDTPGLGIDIDWDVIRRFGKRVYHGTTRSVGINTLLDRGWKQTMYLKEKKVEQLQHSARVKFKIPTAPF